MSTASGASFARVYSCLPLPMAMQTPVSRGKSDVLSTRETILGVCERPLRRWDRSGKFSPHRHPPNGYRCYYRKDMLRLRHPIEMGRVA